MKSMGTEANEHSRFPTFSMTLVFSFFFFDWLQKVKEYSRMCLGKWATPAYDTVDPRNAGHMAKTQSSHAYTRGLSYAVGKPPRHKANL